MNMEEIENYISELESMFELSELEEHGRNILKVGIYIKQLQQENSRLKEELEEFKHKHYLIQGGRGNGKTYLLHLQQENKQLKDNWNKLKEWTKKAVDKYYDCDLRVDMVYKNVLDRMQELEKGDSNEQGRI